MSDLTEIRIEIGVVRPFWRSAGNLFLVMFSLTFIPAMNELFLNWHWSINVLGGLAGLISLLANIVAMREQFLGFRRMIFSSSEEAARWVASEEWK